jgi:hypothetical protein
MMKTIYSL